MTRKVLVVGLGQIGMGYDINSPPTERIATLSRAFAEHGDFELVGGVDIDPERRQLFRLHYGRPAFPSVKAAINETLPSIVVIAVPTNAHYQVFSQVMEIGAPKAILCEKPLSYDLAEAEDMVSRASNSGVMLYTNYMRRCDQAVIEVHRRLADKEIAGPIKGVCWYSKGLFNNGSHYLNLFQYWLGDVVSFQIINAGRLWDACDPEPDIRIEFQLGEVYFHAAREEDFSYHSVELIAANGRLRYECGNMLWQPSTPDKDNSGYVVLSQGAERITSDAPRLQWAVANQMSRHLSGGEASICTGLQGLSTIQVLTRIKKKL